MDTISNICESNSDKIWNLKMRLIRLWKVPSVVDKKYKASLEIVFIDSEGSRINAMVRANHIRLFENMLQEGKAYVISNVAVASNDIKFKPTTHAYRLIFKKETRVYHIEDNTIPLESFQFIPSSKILSETRDDGYLIGSMTISNTNYTTTLMINPDIEAAKASYSTAGIITDIDTKLSWWYKGCKQCFQGLETLSDQFYCTKCDEYYNDFTARYCIRLRIADAPRTASLVIFESASSSFLGISANDLVTKLTMSGEDTSKYPDVLYKFKGKTFIFKVIATLNRLNHFQQCTITISKITCDEEILRAYLEKYNVDLGAFATSTVSPTRENFVVDLAKQKTPSPPEKKKSKAKRSEGSEFNTPPTNKEGESPADKSTVLKSSTKKNLMKEFNVSARKGSKKSIKLNLD
ncbi:hypothetical protein PIB30_019144 [Stylosanthes scabra]|uniref:Replication factor A C-terminal domain-containing protein n=1 Tax=Stylosanthes scabra TaxID=79078 RepID=A0ABU6X5M1_9FABA|nr:hypothetical protein [Stylosanthes scabra]